MGLSMLIWSLVLVLGTIVVSDHELRTYNACPFMVWVGIIDQSGSPPPQNGGFLLHQCASRSVSVPYQWSGSVWGRTGCDDSGYGCQTGDCGNGIECDGAQPDPPVTRAEFKFDERLLFGGDTYAISLTDGFNLPMAMKPIDGSMKPSTRSDSNVCGTTACRKDLNTICPDELVVKNSDGQAVGCKSACVAFDTDEYCCRGSYRYPRTCKPESWPNDYNPRIFKKACPDARTYKYDNNRTLFACDRKSTGSSGYVITFCP